MKYATPLLGLAILMAPVVEAAMADCALAAEMHKDFHGTWCASDEIPKDGSVYNSLFTEGYNYSADCEGSVEINATGMKGPSVSCVVRKVTKFDVCPRGMIFRHRERARALRPFQINPWSPGYHL